MRRQNILIHPFLQKVRVDLVSMNSNSQSYNGIDRFNLSLFLRGRRGCILSVDTLSQLCNGADRTVISIGRRNHFLRRRRGCIVSVDTLSQLCNGADRTPVYIGRRKSRRIVIDSNIVFFGNGSQFLLVFSDVIQTTTESSLDSSATGIACLFLA